MFRITFSALAEFGKILSSGPWLWMATEMPYSLTHFSIFSKRLAAWLR